MAEIFSSLTPAQIALIEAAPLFFVASVDPELAKGQDGIGPVNVSPKGGVPLHVADPNRVAYLDYPGSGNETARHAERGGPITVMICSFDGDDAAIVRLYGEATVRPVAVSPLRERLLGARARELSSEPRQIIDIAVRQTMTSCGYGVPVMQPIRERRRQDRGRRFKAAP